MIGHIVIALKVKGTVVEVRVDVKSRAISCLRTRETRGYYSNNKKSNTRYCILLYTHVNTRILFS